MSQFDFAAENGVEAYKTLTDEAIDHGYDGWMEDFGEYTPLDAVTTDALRLEVQLQEGWSAGIHEWKVKK